MSRWHKFTARIVAVSLSLLPLAAFGQQFPTIPDRSVIGRVGIGNQSGPSQPISFSVLAAQLQPIIGPNTVLGSIGIGLPTPLSQAQITSLCNTFSSTLSGCVPPSGGGTQNFLRADGTFASPGGSSGSLPFVSAIGFGNVSGSAQSTTGTISAASTTLTLASALDFKNGQGIRINHAGAASGLSAVTGLTQDVLHDDTVALQAAVTSANSNNLPLNLSNGIYRITSALTASGPLEVYGSGPKGNSQPGSVILTSPTQDGFNFAADSEFISLHDFGVIGGSGTSSGQIAGIMFNFQTQSEAVWIERVSTQFSFTSVGGEGPGPFFISNNLFNGYGPVIFLTTPGDGTFEGNQVDPVTVPGGFNSNGVLVEGDPGGFRIKNNKFNAGGFGYAIGIFIFPTISDGDILIEGNSIEGWNSAGINVQQGASGVSFGNGVFVGNQIASGVAGTTAIRFFSINAAWFGNTTITGNVLQATSIGIDASNALNQFNIGGNVLVGSATGINVASGSVGGMIGTNNFNGVTTQISDGSGALAYAAITTTKPSYP
jgi:hypothetical protein